MLGITFDKTKRLDQAVKDRDWNKACKLIAKGAVPDEETLRHVVERAYFGNEWADLLLKAGAHATSGMLHTAFMTFGNMELASKLVEAGAVPFQETLRAATVRMKPDAAAWVKLFVQAGGEPTTEMLANAVNLRNKEMAEALVAGGAYSNKVLRDFAAKNLDASWVKLLDEARIPATVQKLAEAVRNGQDEYAEDLIAEGVVPDEKTLEYAVNNLSAGWIALLAKAKNAPWQPYMLNNSLSYNRSWKTAEALIAAGVVPEEKTLSYAVNNLSAEWVELLVKANAPLNPDMAYNSLYYNRNWKTMEALIAGGLVPNEKTLSYAVNNLSAEWVELLVAKGKAQPQDYMAYNSLYYNRSWKTMKALIDGGLVPDEKALNYAVNNLTSDWVELLVAQGKAQPLDYMIYNSLYYNRNWKAVKALIDGGAVPEAKAITYAKNNLSKDWIDLLVTAANKPKPVNTSFNNTAATAPAPAPANTNTPEPEKPQVGVLKKKPPKPGKIIL